MAPTASAAAPELRPIPANQAQPQSFHMAKLDDLIPAPMGPWKKFAVASTLVSLALAFLVLYSGGYLIPEAPAQGSFRGSLYYVDHDDGLVGVRVFLPNSSGHDVRLTDVTLDAPGIEVVRIDVIVTDPLDKADETIIQENGVTDVVRGMPAEEFFAIPAMTALPLVLPSDGATLDNLRAVVIWFRPTGCIDTAAPWGFIEVAVDFGEGAISPISRTYRSDEPLWSGDELSMWDGNEFVDADGPVALACEVLR